MRVAVAGGTGTVGKYVVAACEKTGAEVVIVSRRTGVDVVSGEGLAQALEGVDVVIDVMSPGTLSKRVATRFFEQSSRQLLDAGQAAGAKHHVVLSIVGIDGVNGGYYAAKLAHESVVEQSARLPFTIVRASQFHELPTQFLARMPGPIAYMPTSLLRPVAAREVGEYLARIAQGEPAGRAPDLVGPKEESLAEMARRYLRRVGRKQRVLEMRMPGPVGKAFASGVLRGADTAIRGHIDFETWLASPDSQFLGTSAR